MNEIEQAVEYLDGRLEVEREYGVMYPKFYKAMELGVKALEKDIPVEMKDYYCPKCKSYALVGENGEYLLNRCNNCGQAFDFTNILENQIKDKCEKSHWVDLLDGGDS